MAQTIYWRHDDDTKTTWYSANSFDGSTAYSTTDALLPSSATPGDGATLYIKPFDSTLIEWKSSIFKGITYSYGNAYDEWKEADFSNIILQKNCTFYGVSGVSYTQQTATITLPRNYEYCKELYYWNYTTTKTPDGSPINFYNLSQNIKVNNVKVGYICALGFNFNECTFDENSLIVSLSSYDYTNYFRDCSYIPDIILYNKGYTRVIEITSSSNITVSNLNNFKVRLLNADDTLNFDYKVNLVLSNLLNSEINLSSKEYIYSIYIKDCPNLSSIKSPTYKLNYFSVKNCASLTELELPNCNYVVLTNLNNLTTVKGSFVASNSSSSISSCPKLVGGQGTTFSSTSYTYMRPDGGTSKPGYWTYTSADEYYNASVSFPSQTGEIETNYPYHNYAKGSTIELEFKPYPGFDLDYWLEYDSSMGKWTNVGSTNPRSGEILKDITLYAVPKIVKTIAATTYDVNLSSFPSTAGTVTGAGTYLAGSDVTISAAGTGNYVFQYWQELIGTTWVTYATSATITLEGIGRNRTLRAYFVELTDENKVTLTVNATTGGTAGRSGDYVKGQSVTVNAIVDSGYTFKGWYLVGKTAETLISTKTSYTFKISGDTTLNAVFVKKAYPGQDGGGIDSKPGGGDGTFDDSSDTIPSNNKGHLLGNGNGRCVFVPSSTQLTDFINNIYNADGYEVFTNVLANIASFGGKVSDNLIGIHMLPFTVPTNGTGQPKLGPYEFYSVALNLPKDLYFTINMGSIKIEPYYGNALDYQAKYQLYLPWYGFVDLSAADVVGKTLSIEYVVAIEDGSTVIDISSDGSVKYEFQTNLAWQIPTGSNNMQEGVVNTLKNVLMAGVGGM